MSIYVSFVLFATKIPFDMMVSRGMEEIRAVYYNRKIVHMLAGGVGSLCVPILFEDYWYPLDLWNNSDLVHIRRARKWDQDVLVPD